VRSSASRDSPLATRRPAATAPLETDGYHLRRRRRWPWGDRRMGAAGSANHGAARRIPRDPTSAMAANRHRETKGRALDGEPGTAGARRGRHYPRPAASDPTDATRATADEKAAEWSPRPLARCADALDERPRSTFQVLEHLRRFGRRATRSPPGAFRRPKPRPGRRLSTPEILVRRTHPWASCSPPAIGYRSAV